MDVQRDISSGLGLPQPPISRAGVAGGGPSSDNPQISDDSMHVTASEEARPDALDEEWVNKAKAIVSRTKNDPYLETKELAKTKADYLRIRFNKQVKVAEEHS